MPEAFRNPLVFVSYARPDIEPANATAAFLESAGFRIWFDQNDIRGGQDWKNEIKRVIREARLVLICLSKTALNHKGFFNVEMRLVAEEAAMMPEGTVYVIPVRFDDCALPEILARWQAVDLFKNRGSRLLLRSIQDGLGLGARAEDTEHEKLKAVLCRYNSVDKLPE